MRFQTGDSFLDRFRTSPKMLPKPFRIDVFGWRCFGKVLESFFFRKSLYTNGLTYYLQVFRSSGDRIALKFLRHSIEPVVRAYRASGSYSLP